MKAAEKITKQSTAKPLVLIVDDSEVEAEIIRRSVARNGYETLTARDAASGLELMKARKPSAVLSDVNMPGMSGFEMCAAIRKDDGLRGVPIILISALSDPEDVITAIAAGADGYITKPYDENALLSRIEELINAHAEMEGGTEGTIDLKRGGKVYTLPVNYRRQMNILLSVYENLISQNRQLANAQTQLATLNERLEEKVRERTAELTLEIEERAKAQEALIQSRARYRDLFTNMISGYVYCKMVFDENDQPVDWIYLDANAAFEQMTGLKKEAIIGKRAPDVIPGIEKTEPNLLKLYGRVAQTGEPLKHTVYFAPLKAWFEASVYSPEKGCFVSLFENITDRKLAEDALRQSERRLRIVFENAPIGISISTTDGKIIEINRAMWEIFGYDSAEDIMSRPGPSLYSEPEDRKLFVDQLLKQGRVDNFETLFKRKNGETFWGSMTSMAQQDADGGVLFTNTVSDISARKRSEAALRKSEEKYRGLYESIRDGIVESDMNGNIAACNKEYLDMLGYTSGEITQLACQTITPQKWHEMEREIIEKEVLAKGYSGEFEKELIKKDGTVFPVSMKMWLIRDERGKPKGMWGIVRDITERRQAMDKINSLNEDLRQNLKRLEMANKELEAFSYSVSHDLRAPLRAIDGFCGSLAEDYSGKLDDEGRALLDVVMKNTKKMGKLIDDLLDFARIGRKEMSLTTINMESLARSVFEDLTTARENRPPDLTVRPMPDAEVNPSLMRQVFVNLIANAIKFTLHAKERVIEVGGSSDGEENIYYVKDNGAGFNMKYANKLFGVFQRLHSEEEFKGTGIGLAIVERIVSRHGGRVWAEGEVGKGAAFYFAIPKNPPSKAAPAPR